MKKDFLITLAQVYGLACLCFIGIVFESEAEKPVPILLMILTGILGVMYHSEGKKNE